MKYLPGLKLGKLWCKNDCLAREPLLAILADLRVERLGYHAALVRVNMTRVDDDVSIFGGCESEKLRVLLFGLRKSQVKGKSKLHTDLNNSLTLLNG